MPKCHEPGKLHGILGHSGVPYDKNSPTANEGRDVHDRQIPLEDRQRLLDALLDIRSMRDRVERDRYVAELEARIGRPLRASRHSDARHDVWSLLGAMLARSGALRTFVRTVFDLHGEDPAIRELERLVDEIERDVLLAPTDRDSLLTLLAGVESHHLIRAAEVAGPRAREISALAGNPTALVRRLESIPGSAGGAPLLFSFVDRVAHLIGATQALDLHRWIDLVAGGIGLSQATVRDLCIASRRDQEGGEQGVEPAAPVAVVTRSEPGPDRPILPPPEDADAEPRDRRPIWGGVPAQNPNFTGRESMLRSLNEALITKSQISVLPQTLHGLGGVGKTQLAVEYVYRFQSAYDLIWWIPAEQPTTVLASLAELAKRLELPESTNLQQTTTTVIDALASTSLRWLLVYDNANQPDELARFVPVAGGHVVITSRNQEWTRLGDSVEVDVFERRESIELIRKRAGHISLEEADELADKLGDLPLALEQAATWHVGTRMPISEYLQLFDEHVRELLSEGKPTNYPTTVAAFLALAVERLRTASAGTAQMFELFAYLGAEPLSQELLRTARDAPLSEPLRSTVREPIRLGRAIRDLRRFGLARVDLDNKIQVHRLMQLVLRESLDQEQRARSLRNVQLILAYANPNDPDSQLSWPIYAEIGPHILPAHLVTADLPEARSVVLDQMRYLWVVGDYENSNRLAEMAIPVWQEGTEADVGPVGARTLLAIRHRSNALRSLGESKRARELTQQAYAGLRDSPEFGVDHEYTLVTANSVALDLRILGDYRAALAVDQENLERHRQVFGEDDLYTLRVLANVAVNLRMLGDVEQAYEIDLDLVQQWSRTGPDRYQTLQCRANVARDLLAMGRHQEALDMINEVVRLLSEFDPRRMDVLLASRTQAIALLRLGRFTEALDHAQSCYEGTRARLGPHHEHTLASAMTLVNALRTIGDVGRAQDLAVTSLDLYRRDFGDSHPFTLAAEVNTALLLRAVGEHSRAQELDESAAAGFRTAFGPGHTYTLRATSNLSNDLALRGEAAAARELSESTLAELVRQRGDEHPHTLACAGNVAFDRMATGDTESGRQLLARTLELMAQVLGPDHPDTVDRARGRRAECDLEPSPT
ncbi:FxSxx-COOH system tetratricopeptide repeat protein [Actinoplanes subglobosus]|uniref:FxSxx-COOH system tetratricopeptide repeat protein n=1 Tax=Actinoplanes subglobosus TaxID=1547892 RepID=A0ABV8IR55_9ACTN